MWNYNTFLCFILFSCSNFMFGGQDPVDSLQHIVNTGNTKAKIDALNELCIMHCYNDPGKAKHFAFESIKLCGKENYNEGWGKAFNRLGIAYDVSGNYDSSVYCYKQALTKYKSPKGLGSAYNNLGLIDWKHGKLNEAITYFYKALPYFQQLEDKNYLANLYNNIGLIYYETKDNRKALSYHFKAFDLYNSIKEFESIGATCTNINNVYFTLDKKDSALYFTNLSIKYNSEADNTYGLSIAYLSLGNIYSTPEYGKYKEALRYYFKALELKKELNEEEGFINIYEDVADVYMSENKPDSSLYYNYKALDLAKKHELLTRQKNVYRNLAHYYSQVKNSDSVYKYLQLNSAIKDSIFNQDFQSSLADAETKYQTKEKELTIKSQEYELSKKNYYILALLLSLLIIGLVFFAIYSRYKLQQKNKLQAEIIKQQDIATKGILEAEENERKRVATDLHDSVGQILSAIKINMSALQPNIKMENNERYDNIINMVDNACKEVRAISHNLMPNSLLKNGLVSAIKEFIGQINVDILKVQLNTAGLNQRLENNTEMVLYRVIQESVNNVIKHAQATSLEIQISKDEDGVSLTIEDNGKGFDTSQNAGGIGLHNLRSRIEFLKGEIDIQSSPGRGTLIAIFISSQKLST